MNVSFSKVGTYTNLKCKSTTPVECPKDTPQRTKDCMSSDVISTNVSSGEGDQLKTGVFHNDTNSHRENHLEKTSDTGWLQEFPGKSSPVWFVVLLQSNTPKYKAAKLEKHR
mmetsp:Transcript_10361/g.19342  ORF Transcript_10361/g.19342 Transcript_10361/m.19342 type:complete len:112 (-) Transcript_10361:763-1098(-)